MSTSGLKNRQSELEVDDEKQQIKRLKFDENKEREHEHKGSACKLSESLEPPEGMSDQENKNVTSKDQSKCKQSLPELL